MVANMIGIKIQSQKFLKLFPDIEKSKSNLQNILLRCLVMKLANTKLEPIFESVRRAVRNSYEWKKQVKSSSLLTWKSNFGW